ncbi:sulfite exporter TauE/SafE family protein [Sinanaerobacter sp. ZZT-01]|uniref:sulfite exporter TauE/SafE family protein n=1 Tax=Sinanaerobacter sp. ZZT-01 TaxID=3111540 RepID=UPI002D772489|nr:TSUP family transporter [Sinanaerobacter sp. ZZT-01]WRR92916.1 TSUP family transporter [Sinanaerobacter sp. ZZT-01]
MSYFEMIVVVCPLIFLSSFVDSIAGGGGLISLPAYMITGIPVHSAFGCNKFSASIGTFISTLRYYKNGKINVKSAAVSAILSLAGAAIGSKINLLISTMLLKQICIFLIPAVAVIVLFGGNKLHLREQLLEGPMLYVTCGLIGFFVGMYDGLIGPGTGTFFILAYTSLIGFDYVTASGNAKVANLASNVSSLMVYLFAGKVYFALAVPATLCSILGGWIGSGMAIRNGAPFIKLVLVLVLIGIVLKLIWDMYL